MSNNKNIIKVLFGLVVLAAGSFVYQITNGLSITGLREPVVWGLYVTNFTFCMGSGVGLLFVILAISKYKETSINLKVLLAVTSFITLSLAGIFIIFDLGRIDRFYYMMIYPNFKSPLFWDFISLNLFIAVSLIFCITTIREKFIQLKLTNNKSIILKNIYKVFTFRKDIDLTQIVFQKCRNVIVIALIIFYFITTELFVGLKAHPEWNSFLFSLIFFIAAILCGLSLTMILISFCEKKDSFKQNSIIFEKIKKFILLLLILDIHIIIIKYIRDINNPLIEQVHTIFPFSFVIFLVLGNVLPILLILLCKNKRYLILRFVPILILLGVLLKRIDMIVPVYYKRWLPFPSAPVYIPTIPEILIVLGAYSAAILVLIAIFNFNHPQKDR